MSVAYRLSNLRPVSFIGVFIFIFTNFKTNQQVKCFLLIFAIGMSADGFHIKSQ